MGGFDALVYNSDSVNARPVIQGRLATNATDGVPTSLQAQLTFNGVAQGWVTFSTSGHSAGDSYALPLQVAAAVAATGSYAYSVEVKATFPGGKNLDLGNVTSCSYDALYRMPQKTDPLGHGNTYAFDAANNLTSTTDRDGQVKNFTYDNLNRLETETWIVSGTTTDVKSYSYDANGNVLVASDNNGTYTLAYDPLNRLTSEQEPFGVALTFGYDAVRNRTLVQDSFGGTTTSVYDQANRLTSRQFQGTGVQGQLGIDLSYTARDQLAGLTRYADVTGLVKVGSSAYTYDVTGRVTNIEHANAVGLQMLPAVAPGSSGRE